MDFPRQKREINPQSLEGVAKQIPEKKHAVIRRQGNNFALIDYYENEETAYEVARKAKRNNPNWQLYVMGSDSRIGYISE